MRRSDGAAAARVRHASQQAAAALGARAFAHGQDIHFAAGEFDPHSRHGQRLLAHELAHVRADRSGGRTIRRQEDPNAKDKAPAFSAIDPALIRLSGSLEDKTAPLPVSDAISALVNLGYPQAQASAAIAAALKSAGEEPEAKTLIRLGLRELAR